MAGAAVPARLTQTLVDVGLTQPAGVTRLALAAEGGQAINAGAVVARERVTLVDVCLTVLPGVAFSALAGVLVGPVCALGAIFAWRAGTLVNVYLAKVPSEACGALAEEGVDLVDTLAVVQAGAVGALVRIDLAELPLVAWHADTVEVSYLVQAGGLIPARVRHALVNVELAAWSHVTPLALTLERAFGVYTLPCMLTRVGTQRALVNILITGSTDIARRAGTEVISTDGAGITVGALLTRVADAGVVQLAQKTCAAVRTFAEERSYAVMTGGSMVAGGTGTVVNVLAAVISRPPVHTHTLVAAIRVVARATILAGVGHQLALVNIFCAELTCKFWSTLAVVGVDSIDTDPFVMALMSRTVIYVVVTVFSCKTWHTGTFIVCLSFLDAGASIVTGRRVARQVTALAEPARVLCGALAPVAADFVDAHPAVLAG